MIWRLIYRWPDGSSVACSVSSPTSDDPRVRFDLSSHQDRLELWQDGTSIVCSPQYYMFAETVRKLLGFVLDVGGAGCLGGDLGVLSDFAPKAVLQPTLYPSPKIPIYVPDEAWERRYDLAPGWTRWSFLRWEAILGSKLTGLWLRVIDPISGVEVGESGTTFEGMVDAFTKRHLVLPESMRAVWEEANVERGEWLLPGLEEVELYRVTGEQLPFWWPVDRLRTWILERAP